MQVVRKMLSALFALFPFCANAIDCGERPQGAPDRFGPHEDSYALLYNRMDNLGWAGRDEQAIRGRFSFKYTLCGAHYVRKSARLPSSAAARAAQGWELFLSYTGEFDFYAGSRDSGPVINRLNNPALNLRLRLPQEWGFGDADDNLVLSIEHRSNGQVNDVTSARGTEQAAGAYADGFLGGPAADRARYFFDSISRGSDFVAAKVELTDAFGRNGLEVAAKLRLHFDEEFAVSWGDRRCERRCIDRYDRLQLTAAYRWPRFGWFDAQLRLGNYGTKTDSFTLGYQVISDWLPLYVRYHRGPMNTLSNYSQRQDSIGIGLRFARL